MARAEVIENVNGTDTQIEDEEATAKRERVDLEALQPHDKTQLAVSIPAEFKLQIVKAAEENGKSASEYAREILCQRFEYSLPESFTVRRGRQSQKYAGMTAEERKEAIAREGKQERARLKALLAQLESNKEALPAEIVALLSK